MGSETFWLLRWDHGLFAVINQGMQNPVFDALMPVLSNMALWAAPLGVVWLVFFFRTGRRGKLIAIGCFLVVVATDQTAASLFKPAVGRIRPCNVVPAAHFYQDGDWVTTDKFGLTTYKSSKSFPSNHAANIAGQAVYWSFFYPQITPVLSIAAFAVGVSRVYLGHHWPFDILGGYVLGIGLALIIAGPLKAWVLPDE